MRERLPTPPILEHDPAQLSAAELERLGVTALPLTLEESLEALSQDAVLRGGMSPRLDEMYTAVKGAELDAAQGQDLVDLCARYAAAY